MSTFKQKSLFAALAGLGVLGVVDSAQAVHVNQDGLGQALIYPYYTVRNSPSGNAYVTALSIVNTTASAKAVKVRFLEGRNSREVLDFNLFLSQYDVWTAGIVQAGTGAGVFTQDHSCTSPTVSSSGTNPTKFRNGAYAGSFSDGAGDSLDRTNEGYFEILEMATINGGSSLEAAVTHSPNLSSPNASTPSCGSAIPTGSSCGDCTLPSGGLMGTASLINVNDGTDVSYDATALDGWNQLQIRWSAPGSQLPTLAQVSPAVSIVIDNVPGVGGGTRVVQTNWVGSGTLAGADAVSAILMRSHVYNEYTVEPGIKAATDWIVTMPTKREYVTTSTRARPFQSKFTSSGSCDTIDLIYFDREEQSPGAIIDFSPTTPESRSLCWEANVLTFSANGGNTSTSNIFNSKNSANVALLSNWVNGWADLSFPQTAADVHVLPAPTGSTTFLTAATAGTSSVSTGNTVTYFGLPVIGFAAQTYSTTGLPGVSANVLSNYGGNFNHKYMRNIVTNNPAPAAN
jgi:hypothetical protein